MSLVGRRHELAEVARLLDRTAAGTGGVLVVSGAPGSGKTALADAAAQEAARRGLDVVRASPPPGQRGRLVWASVLGDLGAPGDLVTTLLGDPGPLDLDAAARALVDGPRRLIVVDDLDAGGAEATELVQFAAARAPSGGTALLVVTRASIGLGQELRLGGLAEDDLAVALGPVAAEMSPDALHALWVASRGSPGVARSLAAHLDPAGHGDPVVALALGARSHASFLDIDTPLVRLLELAADRVGDHGARAEVLARLARELLGDASAAGRRRALADEALALARSAGDNRVLATVLDARLHALWDPAAAEDRLSAASEIVHLAQASGDDVMARRGLFWRFVALMELGRVGEAESALAAFEREATLAGDTEALVMVTARHAMLAIVRGRYDEAQRLAQEVALTGARIGLADTDALAGTLRGAILIEQGPSDLADAGLAVLADLSRRLPGHLYEATAAGVLATFGRDAEAATELERILPRALAGSGPRWVGSMAILALVAARAPDERAAAELGDALRPYAGRLAVLGGANTTIGPVSHFLGLLAARLGALDEAARHFQEAILLDEQIGALPFLAHSLAGLADVLDARAGAGDRDAAAAHRERARSIARSLGMNVLLATLEADTGAWSLKRDGEDWVLDADGEHARLRDGRGLHYLRALLVAPGREVPALDLVAGGAGLAVTDVGPALDPTARRAYLRRLDDLAGELDAADRAGDAARAEAAESQRAALLLQLRQATGLGGRDRAVEPEAERARVNVTRTIRATLDRIAALAPRAGSHLQASIRTGRACRYEPAPGGPSRWRL
ncbi:MAG TPA: ATP-binding protein [Acidimicrobiales bacterium]|nr:ATP-binding protein [Acidimicrobiales bacterium]